MYPDLREIRNKVLQIKNRLEYLLNQKKINFERTQPGSPKLKESMVDSSMQIVDTFALYMINDEELDEEIEQLREEYYIWVDYFSKEINRLKQFDSVLMIEFLKNTLDWKWEQIDEYLHCGKDYSRHLYNKHFKSKKRDTI